MSFPNSDYLQVTNIGQDFFLTMKAEFMMKHTLIHLPYFLK